MTAVPGEPGSPRFLRSSSAMRGGSGSPLALVGGAGILVMASRMWAFGCQHSRIVPAARPGFWPSYKTVLPRCQIDMVALRHGCCQQATTGCRHQRSHAEPQDHPANADNSRQIRLEFSAADSLTLKVFCRLCLGTSVFHR